MNNTERSLTNKQLKDHCHACFESLSWTGVIVGALVATGLGFLLNLFNVGIGLSLFDDSKAGVLTIVIGGLLAMFIGGFVTMFVAGWVSGYISRSYCTNRCMGILQGFAAWCLALIISLFLVASNVGFFTTSSHLLVDHLSSKPSISFTRNENAPAISNVQANTPKVTLNAEKSANTVGLGAFITFLIFFIGALASSFGGYFGACRKGDYCSSHEPKCNNTD